MKTLRVFSIILCAAALVAQTDTTTPTSNPHSPKLTISLHTSRSQISAGSGFGIMADVTNVSEDAVFIIPQRFTMTPPPEIDPGMPATWAAVFDSPSGGKSDFWDQPIRLAPGASTTAFWAGNATSAQSIRDEVWSQARLVGFAPGEYTVKVTALYWPTYESAKSGDANYSSQAADIKLLVVAPQWVILLGAVLGGFIAFSLLPNARLRLRHWIWGLLASGLLSAITTILIARVSETQFLIRVSVNDVWGAIAVGFITAAYGTSVINRYLPAKANGDETDAGKHEEAKAAKA